MAKLLVIVRSSALVGSRRAAYSHMRAQTNGIAFRV